MSYLVCRPHSIEQGDVLHQACVHVALFGFASQDVLLLAETSKGAVMNNRVIISSNPILATQSNCEMNRKIILSSCVLNNKTDSQFNLQWSLVNADTKGTCHSVRIIWMSVFIKPYSPWEGGGGTLCPR